MASLLSDFFNFKGDFKMLGMVATAMYCLAAATAVRSKNGGANIFKGTVLTAIAAWGGPMMVSVLLGEKLLLLGDEKYVVYALLAWLVTSRSEVTDLIKTLGVGYTAVSAVLCETLRCHMILEAFDKGAKGAVAPSWYPVACVAPLVCGMMGGVGASFLPLSKGIAPLDGWLNDWKSKSTLILCLLVQLLTRDPNVGPRISALLPPLGNAANVKLIGTAFLALAPIVASVAPNLPNPLGVDAAFKMPTMGGAARAASPAKRRTASPKRR